MQFALLSVVEKVELRSLILLKCAAEISEPFVEQQLRLGTVVNRQRERVGYLIQNHRRLA